MSIEYREIERRGKLHTAGDGRVEWLIETASPFKVIER